jgi:hypothetical protein
MTKLSNRNSIQACIFMIEEASSLTSAVRRARCTRKKRENLSKAVIGRFSLEILLSPLLPHHRKQLNMSSGTSGTSKTKLIAVGVSKIASDHVHTRSVPACMLRLADKVHHVVSVRSLTARLPLLWEPTSLDARSIVAQASASPGCLALASTSIL